MHGTSTYTLWETETKQVRQRMKKLEDKLAFLDEQDYCIAYFYGEADEYANLEDEGTADAILFTKIYGALLGDQTI